MSNYAKGRRLEWKTQRLLEDAGFSTMRTAGSHGPFDVHGWTKFDAVYIQVKANRKPSPSERRKLSLTDVPPWAKKFIWVWHDYKKEPEVIEVGPVLSQGEATG